MYNFSLIDKLSITKSDVMIMPCMVKNLSEAKKMHKILRTIFDYLFPNKKIYIKLNKNFYNALYRKWFPQCVLVDECIDYELIVNYAKKHSITTLDFTKLRDNATENSWHVPISFEYLSVGYLHCLYLSCKLIAGLDFNYNLFYMGKDKALFDKFCKTYLSKQSLSISDSENVVQGLAKIIVINDLVSEKEMNTLWKIIRESTQEQEIVVVFLNNERRYLFYIPDHTEIIEHIIPFVLKNYDERTEFKVTEKENLLYFYTTNNEIQKKLLTAKISKSLDNIGILGANLAIENLYLRGMLDATELKVMHLQQILKNSDVEISDIK